MKQFLQIGSRWYPFGCDAIAWIDTQHAREGGNGTCVRVQNNILTLPVLTPAAPTFTDYTGDDAKRIRHSLNLQMQAGNVAVLLGITEATEDAKTPVGKSATAGKG